LIVAFSHSAVAILGLHQNGLIVQMEMAKGMALYWQWLPVSQLQPEIGAVILSMLYQVYVGQNP
jgi:hypothetical protein